MRGITGQFFRNIPGAIGLNAVVAFVSVAAFLVGYELLVPAKIL